MNYRDSSGHGVLIEAKGNYFNFVNKNSGEFYKWFDGKKSLVNQANRQISVANGITIKWYFNDEISMNAVRYLFEKESVKGIEFILKPME